MGESSSIPGVATRLGRVGRYVVIAVAAAVLVVVAVVVVADENRGDVVSDPVAAPQVTTTVDVVPPTSTSIAAATQSPQRETATAVPVVITQPEVLVGDGPTVEWFDISDTMPPSQGEIHVSGDRFWVSSPAPGGGGYGGPAIWISYDGLTWERYPIDRRIKTADPLVQLHDMTLAEATGHNLVTIDLESGTVSRDHAFDGHIGALAYGEKGFVVTTASSAGFTMEGFLATVAEEDFRESLTSLVIEDGILIATSKTEQRQYALEEYEALDGEYTIVRSLYSEDGVDWTPIADLSGWVIAPVVATDRGFFASGYRYDGSQHTSWYSPDGINWTVQGCCRLPWLGIWNGDAVGQAYGDAAVGQLWSTDPDTDSYVEGDLVVIQPNGVERFSDLPVVADPHSKGWASIEWAAAGVVIVGIQWTTNDYDYLYYSRDGQRWTVQQSPEMNLGQHGLYRRHIVATDTTILLTTGGYELERWLGTVKAEAIDAATGEGVAGE